jgi:DNA-directed RNA polymerase subunit H (RpoH/RPB5)
MVKIIGRCAHYDEINKMTKKEVREILKDMGVYQAQIDRCYFVPEDFVSSYVRTKKGDFTGADYVEMTKRAQTTKRAKKGNNGTKAVVFDNGRGLTIEETKRIMKFLEE